MCGGEGWNWECEDEDEDNEREREREIRPEKGEKRLVPAPLT